MKQTNRCRRIFEMVSLATLTLFVSASSAAQQRQRPPAGQPPSVTGPTNSSVQVTPRSADSRSGNTPNLAAGMKLVSGTITGFAYWDISGIQNKGSVSCQGLTAKVRTLNQVGMQVLSTTSTFTAKGPMTDFSAPGAPKYMLCSYSFDKMPEHVDLWVLVSAPATGFSPAVVNASPFQIAGGKCDTTPQSSLTFILSGGEVLCGDNAYNINLKLTALSAGRLVPAPAATPLLQGGQQGMLAPGTTQSAQPQGTPGVQPGNRQLTTGQNGGAQNTGRKVAPNPQPLSPGQRLTNGDVIKMVSGRVPESVIISSVQSAGKQFDFSPAGCRALQQAHVTASILNAMGSGSVRPCIAIPPSSGANSLTDVEQCERMCVARCDRSPNGNKADCGNTCHNRCTVSRSIVAKLSPPKSLRRMTNPHLAEHDAEIMAVLAQQSQAAERESAEISMGLHASNSAAASRLPTSARLQGNGAVQSLSPGTIQDAHGVNSQITHAPSVNTIVITCSYDTTPRIIQVSGGQSHAVFTPEAKYNPYTIIGCGFGAANSGNSAHISSPSGFKANLNIDVWSDNGISAHLDPWLAGVLDQDNVTLVVAPAGRQQMQQSGFKFYAARGMPRVPDKTPQEVPLAYNSMPQSGVKLSSVTDVLVGWDGLPSNATSAFPSFSYQGNPITGWVFRYAYGHDDSGEFFNDFDPTKTVGNYECWINGQKGYEDTMVVGSQIIAQQHDCSAYFTKVNHWTDNLWGPLGADQWNIPLRPDFVISSYDLYYVDTDPSQICGAWDDSSKDSGHVSNWDFNQTAPNQITVSWPLFWCFDQEAWPFNRLNAQRQSSYGLAVWVWGPRCIDPWTGQKDQNCVNKVKQILG